MGRKKETLLDRLDRLLKTGPWGGYGPSAPPGAGGCGPLPARTGPPVAVVDDTIAALRALGMPAADAKRRAASAAATAGPDATVQDMINHVFAQPTGA